MKHVLVSLLGLFSCCLFGGELLVPHITGDTSDFQTTIYFANTGEQSVDLQIVPYNSSGQQFSPQYVTLAAGAVVSHEADTLFAGGNVSHFTFEDQGAVRVSLGYRGRQGNGLIAHVTPPLHPKSAFNLPQGDATRAFDSLALVNAGAEATPVTITHYDRSGSQINQVVVSNSLASMARLLVVLNDLFSPVDGSYYRVVSEQPLFHIALGGTLSGAENPALFQGFGEGQAVAGNAIWVPHITSSSSDFRTTLTLVNGASDSQNLVLQPYRQDGQAGTPQSISLSAGQSLDFALDTLSDDTSHLAIEGGSHLSVRIGYGRRDLQGLTTRQTPPSPGKRFVFLQGNNTLTWDGFAITNPADGAVQCQIRYLGFDGSQYDAMFLSIPAHGKSLFVPASQFSMRETGYFEFSSETSLSVLGLRGNADSSVLFTNLATSHSRLRLADKTIHDYSQGDQIESVDSDSVVLSLAGQEPPAVGSIIIGSQDQPFLREVLTVFQLRGVSRYQVDTKTVPLSDLILEGTLIASPPAESSQQKLDLNNWDAVFSASASLSAQATGEFTNSLTPRMEVRFEDQATEHFWMGVEGRLAFELSGSLQGSLSGEATFTNEGLIQRTLAYSWHQIGWLPVLVVWELEVDARAEFVGNAEGSLSWATSAGYTASAGLAFDFEPDFWTNPTVELPTPFLEPLSQTVDVSADVTATFHLIPKIHARVYGVLGPYVGLDAYARGSFDILDQSYDLGLGLDGFVGGELNPTIFGEDHQLQTDLFSRYWPLAFGSFAATGNISGVVRIAGSDLPLQGVRIAVYQAGQSVPLQVHTTDDSGQFTTALPVGEGYQASFTKAGYMTETYSNLSVSDGQITFLEPVLQIDNNSTGPGSAAGRIINAIDGSGVDGLVLTIYSGINNTSGTAVATGSTSGSGYFLVENLPAGNYTVVASGDGFQSTSFRILVLGNQTIGDQNSSITPLLAEGETRIILTWGQSPSDLDSWLTGPFGSGRFTLYFANGFHEDAQTSANLDHDDVSSYGPETITIVRQGSGVYRYYVHNYSDGGSTTSDRLSLSGARVQVIRGNTEIAVFNVPTNRVGTVWSVFELEGEELRPINTIGFESDVSKSDGLSIDPSAKK